MKKQIDPTIKAHLIRGALYFLLLVPVCAIPFALAQRSSLKLLGVNSPQQRAWPSTRGNPAALSNAYVARDRAPKRPLVPFAYVEKAPYPFSGGVDRHATASFNDFLYVMGGEFFNGSTNAITDKVFRFDPVANTWLEMAAMPSVYDNAEACAMNGKIYVPGGYAGSGPPWSATHYIYDIATNSWTTGAAVPAPATLWAVVACDPAANKVYVIGGFDGVGATTGTKIYDATANTWGSGAALPDGRYGADGALIAGDIYVAGGANSGGITATTLYRYNIATNTWSAPLAPMTVGCLYGAVGVDTSNRLWIAGGGFCSNGSVATTRTARYDPATNTWATVDTLNEAVRHTNGGFAGSGNTLFNVVSGFTGSAIIANTQQLSVAGGGTPTPTPTGTPSPTPTATCTVGYTTATGTGTVTAGGTDIGNHCDDCSTQINLPFPVSVYGNPPISVASVGSDGDIQFTATPSDKLFWWQGCVPVNPDPASQGPFLNTLFPNYADLVTDESVGPCTGCGIFTQTLGTAPNRQFVIRWKTNYFNSPPAPATAEFEVLLTEGSNTLSVIYGATGDNGLTAVSGIQQDLNVFTSFSCYEAVLTPGLRVDYIFTGCGPPRGTPTPRPRPTPAPRP